MELRIARIGASRTSFRPYRSFVYIEAVADEPSGAYVREPGEVNDLLRGKVPGYYFVSEEYAVWNERCITLGEYEDDAAIIDGRPQPIAGAVRRLRFLTKYNFVLCGQYNVLNQKIADRETGEILDSILKGDSSFENLVDAVDVLPRTPEQLSEAMFD